MTPDTDKIILKTDKEAATYMTNIKGWVSKKGHYYGENEDLARYDGCTHKKCDCGNVIEKMYVKCNVCSSNKSDENYLKLDFKEWDLYSPVCLYGDDKYFFDIDDIEYFLEDNELEPKDLQLVWCKPNFLYEIGTDYWEEIMPEDRETFSEEFKQRLSVFNKFIRNESAVSWNASKIRTEYVRTK